jgi:hypothetical protein
MSAQVILRSTPGRPALASRSRDQHLEAVLERYHVRVDILV